MNKSRLECLSESFSQRRHQPVFPTSRPPVPIRQPTVDDFPDFVGLKLPTVSSRSVDKEEREVFLEDPSTAYMYDQKKTVQEAEKDLKDLVAQSINDNVEEEIDMSLADVEGFKENVKLLPHQIIGRKWMADRETGKKAGGILADDMG